MQISQHEYEVRELIRELLLTEPGERLDRPDFGCGLRTKWLEPLDAAAAASIRADVLQATDRWLSELISVEDVAVEIDEGNLATEIFYVLRKNRQRCTYRLELKEKDP